MSSKMSASSIIASSIIDDPSMILGHIYVIRNKANNKVYIGQTLSHRKNHKRYRPFGYIGRLKDHISEAICNTKKNQCRYLNNAIRLHGPNQFYAGLVEVCHPNELDAKEKYHIKAFNSMYPHGYNLTEGGKVKPMARDRDIKSIELHYKPRSKTAPRSEETKARISEGVKRSYTAERQHIYMHNAQKQHYEQKLKRFENAACTEYSMKIITSRESGKFVRLIIDGKKVHFVGKHSDIDELIIRANAFIAMIEKTQGNTLKLRETPKAQATNSPVETHGEEPG